MKKILLIFGILVALPCAVVLCQDTTFQYKPGQKIHILPKGTTPAPPCDCKDGRGITTTTVNPATGEVTFTYTDNTTTKTGPLKGPEGDPGKDGRGIVSATVDPTTGVLKIVYTDGSIYLSSSLNGTCPSCPPSGGGTASPWIYDVAAYGANPNDNLDDSGAFQRASDAAKAAGHKKVVVDPGNGFYRLDRTVFIQPLTGQGQIWQDWECYGRPDQLRYHGPAGTAAFKIIGLKGSIIQGLKGTIVNSTPDTQFVDIDTTPAAGSTSFVTLKNTYFILGGNNSVGVRMGHSGGGGADISNYNFENCIVFGGRLPGQVGFLVEGRNTLSNAWLGGFGAFLDKAYSNKSGAGAEKPRGNGSVFFFGFGGSHNNMDFYIAFEQTYFIAGGRFEVGTTFMGSENVNVNSTVTVQGATISDYSSNTMISYNMAGSLILSGVNIVKTASPFQYYTDPIVLGSTGSNGTLRIEGGGISSQNAKPYRIASGVWQRTVMSVGKLNSVANAGYFGNELPAFTPN